MFDLYGFSIDDLLSSMLMLVSFLSMTELQSMAKFLLILSSYFDLSGLISLVILKEPASLVSFSGEFLLRKSFLLERIGFELSLVSFTVREKF